MAVLASDLALSQSPPTITALHANSDVANLCQLMRQTSPSSIPFAVGTIRRRRCFIQTACNSGFQQRAARYRQPLPDLFPIEPGIVVLDTSIPPSEGLDPRASTQAFGRCIA